MKFLLIFLVFLLPIVSSAPGQGLDSEEDDTLDDFENDFNIPKITDPIEKKKAEEALEEAEELVIEENEEFVKGKEPWSAALNDASDLTKKEFEQEKTGNIDPPASRYGRGLLEPTGAERVDEASERYFANFREEMRMNRASVPSKYDSTKLGYVSEVKNQKQCGSCVAFSNMAAIETCFKKLTGVFGDYSEQQLVDCGYGKNGANGCNGAYTYAYVKSAEQEKWDLVAEARYPYKNQNPSLTCPTNVPGYNQGAKVTGSYYTYNGDEETLKGLVAKHGAVVTSVSAYGPFQEYKGGVFTGCDGSKTDHAVTVVGYGKDKATGLKFWKIKNSWGKDWGEDGFIRLQRGVGMCGVGKALVTVECGAVAGPTDPTITTEKPCDDKFGNCADLAKTACYQTHISESCPKSCGLCPGQTPARSYTCYDQYTNCGDLCGSAKYANNECKKACGKC